MRGRLAAAALLAASGLALGSSAKGAEAPRIISWSNSKTGNQKTAFRIKPGEKIVFAVEAKGAQGWRWEINREVRKSARGDSLEWTAPNKNGIWKIQVIATNTYQEKYIRDLVEDFRRFHKKDISEAIKGGYCIKDGYYPPSSRKEWIVSTFLKPVKSGESAQKAIDALPAEGGIVELLPGLHEVTETIHIRKSNVAIQGAGKSDIRCLLDPTKTKAIFRVNENWEDVSALENITFRGFKVTGAHGNKRNKNIVVRSDKVNDLAIEGLRVSSVRSLMSLNTGPDRHGSSYSGRNRSRGTMIRNNTLHCCAMTSFYAADADVAYNSLTSPPGGYAGRPDYGMYLSPGNNYLSVHDNYLKNAGSYANLQSESVGVHIFNNTFIGSKVGITARYTTHHGRIENNKITGAKYAGIEFLMQSGFRNVHAINNRIYNCPGRGISIAEPRWRAPKFPSTVNIENNVIYNNGKDGIGNHGITAAWVVTTTNNIIVNNGGYGINLVHEKITETHNYNNIWGNKKGNYNKYEPGKGGISVDPLFADPSEGDFHLKSKAGRWDPKAKKWVKDKTHSPCIDAGDPKADFSREPAPNGGRVNMGAYGNTDEASKSLKK